MEELDPNILKLLKKFKAKPRLKRSVNSLVTKKIDKNKLPKYEDKRTYFSDNIDFDKAPTQEEYQNYKVWTKMIVYGKAKLDSYKQSIDELKEEYEMIGSDGKVTETWKLPKSIDEVKAEIQELIDYGENEIKELQVKREEAFEKLKEKNYEHYI